MGKMETLKEKIKADKKLFKAIKEAFSYETEENALVSFASHAVDWIEAVRNHSLLCVVKSVSRSGMSRTFYYTAYNGNGYRQFYSLLKSLGYRMKDSCVVIGGCGMDMNFNTNYNIIYKLCSLGIITEKERDELAQMTPSIV